MGVFVQGAQDSVPGALRDAEFRTLTSVKFIEYLGRTMSRFGVFQTVHRGAADCSRFASENNHHVTTISLLELIEN